MKKRKTKCSLSGVKLNQVINGLMSSDSAVLMSWNWGQQQRSSPCGYSCTDSGELFA